MRKLWEWIKHPHGWALAPLYIATVASLVGAILCAVFVRAPRLLPLCIVVYLLAALLCGYAMYTLVVLVPKAKQKMGEQMRKHAFTEKIYVQFDFRTIVFALGAFVLNVGNAAVYAVVGLMSLSVWHLALCAYYALLVAMRGGVLLYHGKKRRYCERESEAQLHMREVRKYAVCGVLLVLMPIALSVAIIEIVWHDRAFVRAGLLIYAAAFYTTCKVTLSVRNFFKARRSDDFTVRAIRNVNLADALVSLLALQTAMFHEFSPARHFGAANAATGAAVCVLTTALGISMLINAALHKRKLRAAIDATDTIDAMEADAIDATDPIDTADAIEATKDAER